MQKEVNRRLGTYLVPIEGAFWVALYSGLAKVYILDKRATNKEWEKNRI